MQLMPSELIINEKFKPLIAPKTRYIIVTGGRGSAKSFSIGTISVGNCHNNKGWKVVYSRFTQTDSAISIIPELREKAEILNIDADIKQKDGVHTMTFENGSLIWFKGIKTGSKGQTANLKGVKDPNGWIIDEAEEMRDETVFNKANKSVRVAGLPNFIIIILNPENTDHFVYKKFFEGKVSEQEFNGVVDNVTYIHTTYRDNYQNLSKSWLYDMKIERNKAKHALWDAAWYKIKHKADEHYKELKNLADRLWQAFAHEYLGWWVKRREGVVYSNWKTGEIDESLPFVYGLDFGFGSYNTDYKVDEKELSHDACGRVRIDWGRKLIYLETVFYKVGLSTDALTALLPTDGLIIAESATPRTVTDIRIKGFRVRPAIKGPNSVGDGIKYLQGFTIIVRPDDHNAIFELNNYHEKDGVLVDKYNHLLDALRYAVTYQKRAMKK